MADRHIRQQTLEQIAIKTIKPYRNGILLNGKPQAVPIDYIIEKQFGLSVEYHHLRKNLRVLGQTVFNDSYIPIYDIENKDYTVIEVAKDTILIDTRLAQPKYENRRRFSLAHELAHWLIHQELFKNTHESAALIAEPTGNSVIERQADYLCAAILLPMGQVKKAYYRLQAQGMTGDAVNQMAQLFKVAPKTLEIRLKQHGLV